jgi:hypothetical protein
MSMNGAQAGSFHLHRHPTFGLVIAVVAPFTRYAWPFAILTGIVIGQVGPISASGTNALRPHLARGETGPRGSLGA